MGADGGTIPTRDELVKLKKKPTRVDKDVELDSRWQRCALSCQTLREPVVACGLGRLYNKEAIIQYLLDKEKFAEQASAVAHIRALKDVCTLQLTQNKAFKTDSTVATAGAYTDSNNVPYVCPVTDLPMNGHYKFCFLKTCGCTFSEKAMREIPTEACHKCGKAFSEEDVMTINPTKEEEDELWARIVSARKGKGTKRSTAGKGQGEAAAKKPRVDAVQGSDVYKSIFIDAKKRAEMEKGETYTARAVHRGYV